MADEATPAPEAPAAPAAEAAPAAPTPKPSRRETNPYVRKAAPSKPEAPPPAAPEAPAAPAPAAKPQGQKSRVLTVLRNQLEAERAKSAAAEPLRKALATYAKAELEKLDDDARAEVKRRAGDDPAKQLEEAAALQKLIAKYRTAAPEKPAEPISTGPKGQPPAPSGAEDPDISKYQQHQALLKDRRTLRAATYLAEHREAIKRGQAKATAH